MTPLLLAAEFVILIAAALYFFNFIRQYYRNVARYPPGPFPLPIIGNLHQLTSNNTHHCFERFAGKYGGVFTVWMPRPTVVITRLQPMKEALVKRGDAFSGRPQGTVENIFQTLDNGGVIFAENTSWKEQRRFALETLRAFGMGRNLMEEKILAAADTLLEQLREHMHNKTEVLIDMKWPIQLCIGNVINELLFDFQWQVNDCEKFVAMKGVFERTLQRMRNRRLVFLVQTYPWMRHLPLIGYYGYWQLRQEVLEVDGFFRLKIAEHQRRLDHEAEPTCFVDAYLQELRKRRLDKDEASFSEGQLANVVLDFWFAGMETAATTLKWAVHLLVTFPDCQRKLQEEVDRVIGRENQPKMADRLAMPYTNAFLTELQRMSNIVGFNSFRKTATDTELAGMPIPKDTCVLPQVWSVMMNPDVFTDPAHFDPERFLADDGVTLKQALVDNVVPFGMGKRQCPGEPLAKYEIFLVLVVLMQNFSFERPKGQPLPDLTPIYGLILCPRDYSCNIVKRA